MLAIPDMVVDGTIACRHRHIATLTFTEVVKDTIIVPAILVTVRLTCFASEDDDNLRLCWRRYAALLLSPQKPMHKASPRNGRTEPETEPQDRQEPTKQPVRETSAEQT